MAAPESIAEGREPPLASFLHAPLPLGLLAGSLAALQVDDGGGRAR